MLFVWGSAGSRRGRGERSVGRGMLEDVRDLVDDEDGETVDVGETLEAVPDLTEFFRARDEASTVLLVRAAEEGADRVDYEELDGEGWEGRGRSGGGLGSVGGRGEEEGVGRGVLDVVDLDGYAKGKEPVERFGVLRFDGVDVVEKVPGGLVEVRVFAGGEAGEEGLGKGEEAGGGEDPFRGDEDCSSRETTERQRELGHGSELESEVGFGCSAARRGSSVLIALPGTRIEWNERTTVLRPP